MTARAPTPNHLETVAKLERALEVVAPLVLDHPRLEPLFERLETELEDARRRASTRSRAQALAARRSQEA